MKVLHVAKYDLKGGAARAAYASMQGQRALGIDARLAVGRKLGDDPHVMGPGRVGEGLALLRFVGERLPGRLIGADRFDTRSIGSFGMRFAALAQGFEPDVAVLHSVDGVLSLGEIARIPHPVIWRMHDMWPVAGHRHYAGGYVDPPHRLRGLARRIDSVLARRKLALSRQRQLLYCPPSRWLAQEARRVLGPDADIAVVPNGIDTTRFRPADRAVARSELGIDHDGPLYLFGSAADLRDRRKGGDLLAAALRERRAALGEQNVCLCILGEGFEGAVEFPHVIRLGHVSDSRRLRLAYAASDLTIIPSREENLSLMMLESLACGTPVMAFAIGGMPDAIEPGRNGWLVPELSSRALGDALVSVRPTPAMRMAARAGVEGSFDQEAEARGMVALFGRLIAP